MPRPFRLTSRRLITTIVTAIIVGIFSLYQQNYHHPQPVNSPRITSSPSQSTTSPHQPATTSSQSSTESFVPVLHVVDGDTIDVQLNGTKQRIRLIGVDTPEVVDPRKPVQCFGQQASNYTKSILTNQSVRLESDPTQGDKDKYGRLLRYVFLSDGTNFNLMLIQQGYAHEYTYDIPYQYQLQFKQAEIDARSNNRGLWSPSTCNGITK